MEPSPSFASASASSHRVGYGTPLADHEGCKVDDLEDAGSMCATADQPDPASRARSDWSPDVRRGFPCGLRSDEFRLRQLSVSESQVAYVRRDAYDRPGRVACAAVPAPPVYDAALEVTMCPMVHSLRTSGGVDATGEA